MPPKRTAATASASTAKKAAPKATANRSTTKAKAPTTKKSATTKTTKSTANKVAKPAAKAPAKGRRTTKKAEPKAKPAPKAEEPVVENEAENAKESFSTVNTNPATDASSQNAESQQTNMTTPEPEPAPANTSRKRKAIETVPEVPVAKKIKVARLKEEEKNVAPTQKLHVFVFGEGSSGELGLGTAKNAVDVKRPRLNPHLQADSVGVVQLATGGMHVVALTHDNKILTWGVNDQGSLGRDTAWEGGLVDIDDNKSDDSSDSGSDSGMNPREATPTAIPDDAFPSGTKFVQVAAADSASFALTDDGLVYGWGTFRSNEGIFGFTKTVFVQRTPMLIDGLKKIRSISCGANHVLALDSSGNVFAWGSGQQNQLGRRVVERTKHEGLVPREFGLPRKKITQVACGSYHSFALDKSGNVWAWGLNNFGETGIPENAGEDDAVILKPTKVDSLSGRNISMIDGGGHHSAAVTEDGDCLVWGRLDGNQMGIAMDTLKALPEDQVVKDEHGRPRILKVPTALSNVKPASHISCGADHNIAITKEGKAYAWGFSANYQTGLGTDDDVEVATMIDNTAVREKKLNWAGAGGQYGILTAPAE
ncbi:regulator of chromosome condensation 1/beta-lactamase-inhibitor protein II [Phyllosticta paracitricarpa]|uniref:Ran exchange factor Prp20/Pim1 n=1 Tax=Phyllosticta paracitricarpa TaxID=2016321 RepID=A0ABR1NI15_9PEZI